MLTLSDPYALSMCLSEDVFVHGVRITCAWIDFGDSPTPPPRLHALSQDSLLAPDVIMLSFGAWWVLHRHTDPAGYAVAVDAQLRYVDRMFSNSSLPGGFRRQGRHSTHKVFASTTSCSRSWPEPDGASRVVTQLNRVARARVQAVSGWSWFDREVVTNTVCVPEFDCAGGGRQHSSRFHPAGSALNVLVNMFLQHCRIELQR